MVVADHGRPPRFSSAARDLRHAIGIWTEEPGSGRSRFGDWEYKELDRPALVLLLLCRSDLVIGSVFFFFRLTRYLIPIFSYGHSFNFVSIILFQE